MRIVYLVFLIIAACVLVFNATKIQLDNLFAGDSMIALVGVMASLAVIILMSIMLMTLRIQALKKKA